MEAKCNHKQENKQTAAECALTVIKKRPIESEKADNVGDNGETRRRRAEEASCSGVE